ncbi:MAG: TAT-variant-translocated molybdopterin oxidoreductase [Candidatus Krumholzibacteriia bacterium]
MSSLEPTGQGRTYWRSLAELADSEEYRRFLREGFPEPTAVPADAFSRRRFLQLMGASLALAGLAGCRWPQETILPFVSRPDGYVPGVPKRYATFIELAGVAAPLLVTSFDGRPIKVEGNPDHPCSLGAADVFAQASVLELYDPDRSRAPVQRAGGQRLTRGRADFDAFARDHFAALRRAGGAGLAVLSEATSSPTVLALRARLRAACPAAAWHEYEPLSRDAERIGAGAAFGRPARLAPALERARVIVDLDADLLGAHPAALRSTRLFAQGRRPGEPGGMNRLYVVESAFSPTGTMADHRYATPARLVQVVAGRLAAELFLNLGLPLPAGAEDLRPALAPFLKHPHAAPYVPALARDLLAHRGAGLVATGASQPAGVHALAALLNAALGNLGAAAVYLPDADDTPRPTHMDSLVDLADALDGGGVDTLVMLGGNPAFDGPVDQDFGRLIGAARTSIHLSLHENETSRLCTWHVPRAHPLESWGDARAWDGSLGVTQPLIAPLFDGRTAAELLSLMVDETPLSAHALTRRTVRDRCGGDDAAFAVHWRTLLEAGVVPDSAAAPLTAFTAAAAARLAADGLDPGVTGPTGPNLEIVFARDPKLFDGRFANNAWLQELPEPMAKLTWDNAALIGPVTAARLGLKDGEVVRLKYRGRELELPVLRVPGVADWSVLVQCGQGRTAAGRVGNGAGADVYRLRTHQDPWFDLGLAVERTGRDQLLACTQLHHIIDTRGMRERGRRVGDLIRESTAAGFAANPGFARHDDDAKPAQLWREPHDYAQGHRWGLAIDLNACTGCNACVVACQAENNIPVVGRQQVANGREMQWIRLDRYYTGPASDPRAAHQPLACVQCENAPCESVCPVAATVHSHEGLNTMVYNRCVGTRYCSNNCPYKVRRFNFFNYHRHLGDLEKMIYNPEVTIRSRGVMEKCTYCVQRIEAVKIAAKNGRRPIRDGEVTPACAQTCPAGAIVFGDLNDPGSRVARLHADDRAYAVLGELNVRPRTAYLARLRNPNPELAEPAHETGGR